MKTLRIRVNDKVYDVTVEVLSDDDAPVAAVSNGGAKGAAKSPERGPKSPLPPPPVRPAGNGNHDPNAITAPIAGTVQKVFVQAGGHVEAKAPVLLMDAMKMDTYIYAPRSGTIAKVSVSPGDAVRVGQPLFEYEEEA